MGETKGILSSSFEGNFEIPVTQGQRFFFFLLFVAMVRDDPSFVTKLLELFSSR